MDLTELFEKHYPEFRLKELEDRYLPYSKLLTLLDKNWAAKKELGNSFLNRKIFLLKLGNGEKKVLGWSQMHGNETTGTRAIWDVINMLNSEIPFFKNLLNRVTFYFIPMLNPDGAEVYKRRNAAGIDLNRDFLQEASPEIKLLKKAVKELKPEYLLNLHDQRTIFNVSDSANPATLAFLAPAENEEREVTPTRIRSMSVISHIYNGLKKRIPNRISRFSDEFYPTSTGDNFTRMGYSAILFEAGHYPGDYSRNKTRKYFALALLLALEKIVGDDRPAPGDYFSIPENNKKYLDIILRNVRVASDSSESITDIGIYFEEKLNSKKEEVEFISKIEEVGDLTLYHADVDEDMDGAAYKGNTNKFPEVGEIADFSAGPFRFDKGRFKG